MSAINIVIGEKYYSKDPQSSELGKNIVSHSIELLAELGFEDFTFKKLAERINSTEASIYRYFDNKLKLLVYLTTWYWAWIEYQIDFKTHHLKTPKDKLKLIIRIVCNAEPSGLVFDMPGINLSALRQLVQIESDKTYLTKKVDEINSQGLFMGFKGLCHKIAEVISEINPGYKYPHALVSTMLEAAHQQAFFALHLPRLTEVSTQNKNSIEEQVTQFIEDLVFKQIN